MTTLPRNDSSKIRIGSRLAVGAGAAALCLGIAVPGYDRGDHYRDGSYSGWGGHHR